MRSSQPHKHSHDEFVTRTLVLAQSIRASQDRVISNIAASRIHAKRPQTRHYGKGYFLSTRPRSKP
eukprot:159435-Karenia_brevis.AAC.1